jgi:hypothetical protein
MATMEQVLVTAQTHLNDYQQTFWTKDLLQVFLAEAHREMQLELQLNGIPVVKKKSAIFTIPAVLPSSSSGETYIPTPPGQPNDIIIPLECWERPTGDPLQADWDLMIQKSWVPPVDPVQELIYWNWTGEIIKFPGAIQSNDIKLYYQGGIPIPVADNDSIGFIFGELYVAPRLAALAARSIGGKQAYQELSQMALSRMDKILSNNVNAEQALPVRRRPYRHGRRPFVIR